MAAALLSSGVRHRMLEVVLTTVKYGEQGVQLMTLSLGSLGSGIWKKEAQERETILSTMAPRCTFILQYPLKS